MKTEADAAIRKAVADSLERMTFRALSHGVVTSTAVPETTLDVRKSMQEWGKMLRQARRTQVTFVVQMGHQGPPLKHDTPCDGTRFELSYHQAAAIHQQWPMKLHKVIATDEAEFVPVSGVFSEYVPLRLQPPPYDLPPDETPEERT